MAARVALAVRALSAFPISVVIAAGAGFGEFVAHCGLRGQKTFYGPKDLAGSGLLPLASGAVDRGFGLFHCVGDCFKPAFDASLGRAGFGVGGDPLLEKSGCRMVE